ncbi:MAG: 3-coathanger stack domain-containing protein [Saprospiraceae bacterium]
MKKYILKSCLVILLGAFVAWPSVYAQLNIGGEPFSSIYDFRQAVPVEQLPTVNIEQLRAEDERDQQNNEPPRFGFGHEVDLDLYNAGSWYELPNGDRVWQLSFYCPDAVSINFLFKEYWLPEGAVLYVYNKDKSHQIGGFTARNNKISADLSPRGFATGLVYGDFVTLEYYEPKTVSSPGIISIEKVVHGYRVIDIRKADPQRNYQGSGSCQVDVNCAEGNDWQEEKRGVAIMLINGTRWCTGSLVNNTCGNFDPLFLTADHCLSGRDAVTNSDASSFSFMWDYEALACGSSGSEPNFLTTSGATVLANDDEPNSSDFALLRLDEDPADLSGFTPFYNGWDRNNNPGVGGVGIHHPAGDVKKIATHTMLPTGACGATNVGLPRWLEVFWNATANGQSVTEGGSSGSPLFNNGHRIVGQLLGGNTCSGQPNCSNPAADEGLYGAMAYAWNNNGATDNRRRLRTWLDPCNTGDLVVDGMSACHTTLLLTDDLNWAVEFESSKFISANNEITAGSNNGFGVRYDAGQAILLLPGFTARSGSRFHAFIDGCGGANPRNENVVYYDNTPAVVETLSTEQAFTTTVYPNPFAEELNVELRLQQAGIVQLSLYTASGQLVKSIWENENRAAGLHNCEIDGRELPNGIYFLSIQVDGVTEVKSVSLNR